METFQFTLIFVSILVVYALVHMRLARFEAHLKKVAVLELLNKRLEGVSDVLERVRLDHVEDLLGQLHDDLVAIREGQDRVRAQPALEIARPQSGDLVSSMPSMPPMSPGDRVRAMVETRLLSLGYSDLRILTDLSNTDLDAETVVKVECSRQNMVSKGRVVSRNGSIVDVDLTPVAQAFP